jgi:hypothetical protein
VSRIILDLCGGSGSWSKPYLKAGYDVRLVTLPFHDVRKYVIPKNVHGILAAPPCDHFSVSGAQYWKVKDSDGRTAEAVSIVLACLDIIYLAKPVWWALENPVGRLKKLCRMGTPRLIFNPCEYGDPYTKKTLVWGDFAFPARTPVKPERVCSQGSWIQKLGGKSEKTKYLRSLTPPGFAQAFFEANP